MGSKADIFCDFAAGKGYIHYCIVVNKGKEVIVIKKSLRPSPEYDCFQIELKAVEEALRRFPKTDKFTQTMPGYAKVYANFLT